MTFRRQFPVARGPEKPLFHPNRTLGFRCFVSFLPSLQPQPQKLTLGDPGEPKAVQIAPKRAQPSLLVPPRALVFNGSDFDRNWRFPRPPLLNDFDSSPELPKIRPKSFKASPPSKKPQVLPLKNTPKRAKLGLWPQKPRGKPPNRPRGGQGGLGVLIAPPMAGAGFGGRSAPCCPWGAVTWGCPPRGCPGLG